MLDHGIITALRQSRPLIVSTNQGLGHLCLIAGVDALNSASLADAANRALVQDLAAWLTNQSAEQTRTIALPTREHIPRELSRRLGLSLVVILPFCALQRPRLALAEDHNMSKWSAIIHHDWRQALVDLTSCHLVAELVSQPWQ